LVGGALVFVIDPENQATFSVAGLGALYSLSDSEVSVCDLVLKGLSNRQIAEERGVSSETVKSQVSSIFLKTRRESRLDLMRLVVKINPPLKSE
jgi:DNA-binding NarL/FixJ family response regulator